MWNVILVRTVRGNVRKRLHTVRKGRVNDTLAEACRIIGVKTEVSIWHESNSCTRSFSSFICWSNVDSVLRIKISQQTYFQFIQTLPLCHSMLPMLKTLMECGYKMLTSGSVCAHVRDLPQKAYNNLLLWAFVKSNGRSWNVILSLFNSFKKFKEYVLHTQVGCIILVFFISKIMDLLTGYYISVNYHCNLV